MVVIRFQENSFFILFKIHTKSCGVNKLKRLKPLPSTQEGRWGRSLRSDFKSVSMIRASFIEPNNSLLTMSRLCSAKKLSLRCIMGVRSESVGCDLRDRHLEF